jgi:hypothetical protein
LKKRNKPQTQSGRNREKSVLKTEWEALVEEDGLQAIWMGVWLGALIWAALGGRRR